MKESAYNERIDNYLQRIANVLLINASFINNTGLLNGKTGIEIGRASWRATVYI